MPSMRAILVKDGKGPVENLHIGHAERPVPGPNQVLVKVKAFGLNRLDIAQRDGLYPPPAGVTDILGVEFSGDIAEVGSRVTKWKQGDAVFGLAGGGAYAEYIVLAQGNVLRKPDSLSYVEAAGILENFLTAFQALILVGEFKKGENVLIHAGASGVGVAAIQLARFYGAKTVTATASSKEKLDWLLSLDNGATHVVNYKTQDFAAEVKTTTGGKGVDVIIDFVGQSHWHKNIDALAVDGRMTLLAFLSGAEVPSVSLMPILFKRLRIQGSTLRSRSDTYQAELIERFRKEVLGELSGPDGNGRLRVLVDKVYPWTEIQQAHRDMEENKNTGKLVAIIS